MDNDVSTQPSRLARLIPMLVLIVCFGLAETALYIVAIIQFIWAMVNGQPNDALISFGASLSKWMEQDAKYLSYASEHKPFPWAKWPE